MQAKYDGWLMQKRAFIQGKRPDKRHFDVPDFGTIKKFSFENTLLDPGEEELELGWGVIWENGLPYREDRFMMEKEYFYIKNGPNGTYTTDTYKMSPVRHKSRIYTWRYPNSPLEIPPALAGVVDVPGAPMKFKASSYVWIGGEHHTPYGHYAKQRGTDKPLPELLSRCYGYTPKDKDHIIIEAGAIAISAGRVLTTQPSRPDVFIIITSLGQFCVQDLDICWSRCDPAATRRPGHHLNEPVRARRRLARYARWEVVLGRCQSARSEEPLPRRHLARDLGR